MTLIAMLAQLLIPVAVDEVKKKLAEKQGVTTSVISTAEAAVPAIKAVAAGSMSSKTAWFSLALLVLGFVEQNQQMLSALIPADKLGYVIAGIGAVSFFLRGLTTSSLVEKSAPKE